MEQPVSRRQLLGIGGAAVALSIAGCSSIGGGEDGDEGGDLHEVMVVAEIDQDELQDAQEEAQATHQQAQEDLQEGEIDQEEAQRIFEETQADVEETQRELLEAAISAIESHADDVDELSVTDTNPEYGVALVEGSGDALIELLTLEEVQAILDSSQYDDL